MKSPCALLPLCIHHADAQTHRSMVNVFAEELGEGLPTAVSATGPKSDTMQKVVFTFFSCRLFKIHLLCLTK